jgi:hypothetical protein
MLAAAWQETQLAMIGALRLARGDRDGLACFDRSLDGFWRSFRAAVIAYPLFLVLLRLRLPAPDWAASSGPRIILVETIGYVISWVLFPLVLLPVTRALGREHRFFDFMVPYNWSQVLQSALFVLVAVPSGAGVRLVGFAAACAVLLYEWYIARVGLDVSRLAAALVVLLDIVLSLAVGQTATGLH